MITFGCQRCTRQQLTAIGTIQIISLKFRKKCFVAGLTFGCRKSWKRTFLHPARSRTVCSRFRTVAGSLGESSLTGDGNIHLETTASLYFLRTFKAGEGRMTLRLTALVLGGEITNSPLTRWTWRSTRSSPVRKLRSLHWRAQISPLRRPVESSSSRSSKQLSSLARISSRWISSGVSTCISLALAGGRRQPSAGLRKMSFSETALSNAAWSVVWMPRTVWSERLSP